MEIANEIINFFGIELLNETSTFIDYMNCLIKVGVGVFVICFFIRSLLLVCLIPERKGF